MPIVLRGLAGPAAGDPSPVHPPQGAEQVPPPGGSARPPAPSAPPRPPSSRPAPPRPASPRPSQAQSRSPAAARSVSLAPSLSCGSGGRAAVEWRVRAAGDPGDRRPRAPSRSRGAENAVRRPRASPPAGSARSRRGLRAPSEASVRGVWSRAVATILGGCWFPCCGGLGGCERLSREPHLAVTPGRSLQPPSPLTAPSAATGGKWCDSVLPKRIVGHTEPL